MSESNPPIIRLIFAGMVTSCAIGCFIWAKTMRDEYLKRLEENESKKR